MRTCNICKETKPLEQFPKDSSRSLGHAYRCKPCNTEKSRQFTAANQESETERKNQYYALNRDKVHRRNRRWWRNNPEKAKAYYTVRKAIATGDIHHPKEFGCLHCKGEATVFHHEDYSRPLDLLALCKPCHTRLHRSG